MQEYRIQDAVDLPPGLKKQFLGSSAVGNVNRGLSLKKSALKRLGGGEVQQRFLSHEMVLLDIKALLVFQLVNA